MGRNWAFRYVFLSCLERLLTMDISSKLDLARKYPANNGLDAGFVDQFLWCNQGE
jgi:hypothetical protein